MSLEDAVICLRKIFSPLTTNTERTLCYQVTENYKACNFKLTDLNFLCSPEQEAPLVLFGLNCLEYRVKRKWADLSVEEKNEARQCVCCFVTNFNGTLWRNSEGNAVSLIITQIIVHLIKCEWPQQWPAMVTELISLGKAGLLQSLIVFDIFRRLSEDILFFHDVPIKRRRELCTMLSDNVPQIVHFTLDSIFSAVKFHDSFVMDFSEDTIRTLRSALMLLSALFEWCNLTSLLEWKAPEQCPSPLETVPSVQLLLFLLRLQKVRAEAAEILNVMLAKKQNNVTVGVNSAENLHLYTILFAFTPCADRNPISTILDISQSAFTMVDFDESACIFMRRWADLIAILGTQVIEDWTYSESKGSLVLDAFDLLIQANVFSASHPSRLFAASAGGFFKALLSSKHSTLISLLTKYMPKLLSVWMDNMVLQSFPAPTDPMASWMHSNCEKDEYTNFLIKTRTFIKSKCILLAASLWPTEVLHYLIDWHKRILNEEPKPEDLILPSKPFINPSSPLTRQWEALSFAMDKTVAAAYSGGLVNSRTVTTPTASSLVVGDPLAREAGRRDILAHLRFCFASTNLPADPGVRQYHLSILHTIVIGCVDAGSEFALQLLMQDFATLRYNPQVVSIKQAAAASTPPPPPPPPPPVCEYFSLRCRSVREMHMSVGVNVFRIVRAQTSAMLPFFDSFCSELNDILENRYGGLGEQCILLEVVVYLALCLPCSFEEQRGKLESILARVLAEWSNPESLLIAFGTEAGATEDGLVRGLDHLLEYFGLTRNPSDLVTNASFMRERITARLRLRWISAATVAILRRLNAAFSPEQIEKVSIPLIERSVGPVFNLLRTLNKLWQPETLQRCHPSMRSVLDVTYLDKAMQANIKVKNPLKNGEPESLVTIVHQRAAEDYVPKLQTFLAQIYESTIHTCGLLLEITANHFFALPTDQLNQLLYNYVLPGLDSMPEFRLLQLLRYLIMPYVRFCPAAHIHTALVPLMPYILDALFQKVNRSWDVLKLVNKDEVNEEEALEEIFVEETVRSLSTNLVEITRLLLAFTGARPRRQPEDVEVEGAEVTEAAEVEVAQDGETGLATASAASVPIEFGPVARALLAPPVPAGDGEMFVRITSWLTAAANWPDSKVCTKAATLLVRVIDYTLGRDTPNTNLRLPAGLASQLLISGLQALQTNGRFLSEVGSPLFNLIGRTIALIDGGLEGATTHLEPILLSALGSCQDTSSANQHLAEVKKYTRLVFDRTKPSSERYLRERLKTLLQPIIGIPVAEQYKQALSISTLEPLKRPSLRSRRRQRQAENVETRSELAIRALADLFGMD